MNVQLFIVTLLFTFFQTVFTQRDSQCLTPNNETAICIRVRSCQPITDAIRTEDQGAIDFAKESQCGYDTEPLVCCGTVGYFNLPSIFDIFTKAPDPFDIFTKTPEASATEATNNPQQDAIISNFNPDGLPDRTVCGLDFGASRITGGEVTEMDEFPWMAALEYQTASTGASAGIRCGGTVINNRHVLTAAHCIINIEFELTRVWLGEWKISTDPDCEKFLNETYCADRVLKLKIKELIPHPFYSERSGDNDIGLLRLEEDITYTNYIRPICLPQFEIPPPPHGTQLTVSGWGSTENGTSSDIKLKVSVPLISNAKCLEKVGPKHKTTANQLCAGGEEGKDSCKGDSGGPLMRMYEDKTIQQIQWYQEGVVSFGVGCGRVGYPAIYTRVNRYISWILNNIKDPQSRV